MRDVVVARLCLSLSVVCLLYLLFVCFASFSFLFCFVLLFFVLFCFVLFCFVLFCFALLSCLFIF